jgi:hypothetical protein
MIRHIEESMPLFADLPEPAVPSSLPPGVKQRDSQSSSKHKAERHLVAANRLAKAIRRLPDHSPEQTRAGQAICQHLIALLEESSS